MTSPGMEECITVDSAGWVAIRAGPGEGVPVSLPGFMWKGIPPVIPSYLTLLAISFFGTVLVVSEASAGSLVVYVVAVVIGVSWMVMFIVMFISKVSSRSVVVYVVGVAIGMS